MISKVNPTAFSLTENFKTVESMYNDLKAIKSNARNLLVQLLKDAKLTVLNTDYDVLDAVDADYLSLPFYDRRCDSEIICHCASIELKEDKLVFNIADEICESIEEDEINSIYMVDAYCTAYQILTAEDFDYDAFIAELTNE